MDIQQTLDIKQENWLDLVTLYAGSFMFGLLIVIVSLQVLIRTLNLPFTAMWTEPIARYLFIGGTFVGAAVASRNNEHIKLTLIVERLFAGHKRVQFGINMIVLAVVLFFLVVAIYGTALAAIANWGTRALGGIVTITTGYIYLIMCLSFVAMLVYETEKGWTLITESKTSILGSGEIPDTSERGDS